MILAIDPSLTHTAILGIQDGTIVKTWMLTTTPSKERFLTASEKDAERIQHLVIGITSIIDETSPEIILAEQSIGATPNASSTKALSLVAGMMTTLSTLQYGQAPWQFIRVHDVKRAFLGKPQASKKEMISEALRLYPELKEKVKSTRKGVAWNGNAEHLADAAAVYTAWKNMGNTIKGGAKWYTSSGAPT